MTKRKRGRQHLTAAMLPLLRDHAVATLDDRARFYEGIAADPDDPAWKFMRNPTGVPASARRTLPDGGFTTPEQVRHVAATYRAESAALRDDAAVLWYVTEAMTKVAAAAAADLPEWSPSMARPARAGLIVWDGSTGQTCPVPASGAPTPWASREGVVVGVWWDFDAETGELGYTPLVRAPDDVDAGPGGVALGDLGRTILAQDVVTGFAPGLRAMIGATWLLAQSPTVGHTWGIRYDRNDPDRPFAKPTLPSQITVVTLREVAATPEPGDPWDDGLNRQARKGPTYRHLVRGHWRQQPCGPGRRLRKPVFVAPFARGPGDLVMKPTVHVWRR